MNLVRYAALRILFVGSILLCSCVVYAHDSNGKVTYLANEGLMIEAGDYKVLFDPFFHDDYGHYQLVPDTILTAIMTNTAPYNNIDAIFVSHAHGDHFAAQDMLSFLQKQAKVKLIAPTQVIEKMASLTGFTKIQKQVIGIALEYGDKPQSLVVDNITVDALRIPHAGWPGRAEVSNIVFRVTLKNGTTPSTYVHMGDADPKDEHFRPHAKFWQQTIPDMAFPPYWFFSSIQGNYILDARINATQTIGVHVPLVVPKFLKTSGKKYFYKPGETADIKHAHE